MGAVFSTAGVPTSERINYWRKSATPLFDDSGFHCAPDPRATFSGRIDYSEHGALMLFKVDAVAHRVHRTRRRTANPSILITAQVEGDCHVRHGDHHAVLHPGDFTVLRTDLEFDLLFESSIKQFVLRAPMSLLDDAVDLNKRASGVAINSKRGVGRVGAQLLTSFVNELPYIEPAEAARVLRSLMAIVNSAALSATPPSCRDMSTYSRNQYMRIRAFIDEHLREYALSPTMIANAHGISVRTLNKLFEGDALSVHKHIWTRRLQKCRADILDPLMQGYSLTEIAFSWGFKSSSHFSRTFKEHFGHSPSELRSLSDVNAVG